MTSATRTYAILARLDGPHQTTRSTQIALALAEFGFTRQQDGLYVGDASMNAVHCITTVQKVARRLEWFSEAARTLRLLRIDEDTDLMPAIKCRPTLAVVPPA